MLVGPSLSLTIYMCVDIPPISHCGNDVTTQMT